MKKNRGILSTIRFDSDYGRVVKFWKIADNPGILDTPGKEEKMGDERVLAKRLLSEKEVAAMGIKSVQGLRNDRWLGRGLPYIKIGKSVKYSVNDIRDYLKRNRVDPDRGDS